MKKSNMLSTKERLDCNNLLAIHDTDHRYHQVQTDHRYHQVQKGKVGSLLETTKCWHDIAWSLHSSTANHRQDPKSQRAFTTLQSTCCCCTHEHHSRQPKLECKTIWTWTSPQHRGRYKPFLLFLQFLLKTFLGRSSSPAPRHPIKHYAKKIRQYQDQSCLVVPPRQ